MSIVFTTPVIQTYRDIILADSPLHYWRLGEASSASPAVDEVGTTNGTYQDTPTLGQPALIAGDADTSMQTRGTIISTNAEGMQSNAHLGVTGDFSLECWYQNAGVHQETYGMLMAQYNNSNGFIFSVQTSSGFVEFDGKFNNGAYRTNRGSIDVDDGSIHHIVVINTSNVATMWVDGVQDTLSLTNNFLGDLGGGVNPLRVGFHLATTGPDLLPLNGTMDEVAVYNFALSGAQVGVHYDAGV